MDPITGFALIATLSVASVYILYWTIRKAVAGGIRDARGEKEPG